MEVRGARGENDTPAVVAAVRDGDLGMVMQLVQRGHCLHERDKDGATALYWACSRGHSHISDFLLNAGSDVNARVKLGATPLLAAVDNGQEICTSQLLRKHADVNAANIRGDTPLHAAAYRGYVRILCMLMEAGANPFLKNSSSMTPLQEAFVQRNLQCVERLQQYMDVPGLSGPISLPSPSQENTSSYRESLDESFKSWPYVPTQSRSRLSQTEQLTQSNSLLSANMNTSNKTKTPSLQLYDTATSLSEHGNSDLHQPTAINVKGDNAVPVVASVSSFHRSHYRSFDDIRGSSISELTAKSKGAILSFDSLLHNAVSIPSIPGCQVLYNGRNSRSNDLSNKELKSETLRTENLDSLEQYKPNKDIQTAPLLATQVSTSNQHKHTDSVIQGVTSNRWSHLDLNQAFVPEKRFPNTKHVLGKLIPGDKSEFVERLQLQVAEMEEKIIQANAVIANLRDQLICVHRANKELKSDNLLLRNLLHQRELSCVFVTRGTSESSDSGQYTSSSPELLQSVTGDRSESESHAVSVTGDRSESESHAVSRQAIESSEYEDSPS